MEIDKQQLFTLEKANSMIPLVRLIVRDIVELTEKVKQTRRRLAAASENAVRGLEHYHEEVQAIRSGLQSDEARIEQCLAELDSLGLATELAGQGQIEFPAKTDNNLIFLAWQFDDSEVRYWRTPSMESQRNPIESLHGLHRQSQLGVDRKSQLADSDEENWKLSDFDSAETKFLDNN